MCPPAAAAPGQALGWPGQGECLAGGPPTWWTQSSSYHAKCSFDDHTRRAQIGMITSVECGDASAARPDLLIFGFWVSKNTLSE